MLGLCGSAQILCVGPAPGRAAMGNCDVASMVCVHVFLFLHGPRAGNEFHSMPNMLQLFVWLPPLLLPWMRRLPWTRRMMWTKRLPLDDLTFDFWFCVPVSDQVAQVMNVIKWCTCLFKLSVMSCLGMARCSKRYVAAEQNEEIAICLEVHTANQSVPTAD